MRDRIAVGAVIVSLLASNAVAQSGLPKSGVCKHTYDGRGTSPSTSVRWSGEDATIEESGRTASGKVVGMRDHDEGFKFSIFFEDEFTGPSEIVIFQRPSSDPPRYRMARIGYDDLPGGDRVVALVFGFDDVTCTLKR